MTPLVRLWILISAFASLAGWTLSALGQLNRPGYAVCFGVFAVFVFLRRKDLDFGSAGKFFCVKRFLRRFRRPLPMGFAALALLVFFGGAHYPPTHYTALAYHIPRVLDWLAAGHWQWIHTPDPRMNFSGCGFEWIFAPLLLFTKSVRPLFILNFISFLFLPGLVFSVFTRLGVRARVAWHWMWLLPTGYIFLLQGGSAGNDALAAVFALALVDFGARAWESRRPRDLVFSLLAAVLMTGIKPVSLPLLLPWLILVFPLAPWLRRHIFSTLLVLVIAAVVSFFPIAVMNTLHTGDWLGTTIDVSNDEMQRPLTGIAGNAFQLSLQNFTPPLFPAAKWWNQHVEQMLPQSWNTAFQPGFCQVGELPTEDLSGLGLGLGVLLVVSVTASLYFCWREKVLPSERKQIIPREFLQFVLLAPWIALAAFAAKSAMCTPARLIAPYYPLLLPLLLVGAGPAQIVRRRWWRILTAGVWLLALVVLVLSPDRPLWPAQTVLKRLAAQHPGQHLFSRALEVYTVYAQRADALASVRALLPKEAVTVGFIGTEDDCEISLWLPLGGRRVENFLLSDPPERFRQAKVEYVVVGGFNLKMRGRTLDDWRQQTGAELIATTTAIQKVNEGVQPWFITRIRP
ncbi:MAG TPA: hypothetical protein VGI63_03235 [Verrucomicrobiae bacterium]|jgi:hypothetical protein